MLGGSFALADDDSQQIFAKNFLFIHFFSHFLNKYRNKDDFLGTIIRIFAALHTNWIIQTLGAAGSNTTTSSVELNCYLLTLSPSRLASRPRLGL